MRGVKHAACPSIHPTAIPWCFTPYTHSNAMRFRPTWGRFCKAAGVQRGVWCSVPCRAAWSSADQGGELRAAGEGARGWTRLYTPSTSGLHGRSVGGSPLWAGTGVGELFPRSKAWGGVKSWQGKGSPRLNYAGFACPTQGTAASGETRAS